MGDQRIKHSSVMTLAESVDAISFMSNEASTTVWPEISSAPNLSAAIDGDIGQSSEDEGIHGAIYAGSLISDGMTDPVQCTFKACRKYVDRLHYPRHYLLHPSEIVPNLYLGGMSAAGNLAELEALGVSHILNVAKECDNSFGDQFVYLHIPLEDTELQPMASAFDQSITFLSAAEKESAVSLVHCQMGSSRSAAVVIALLMVRKMWTLGHAYRHVKAKRSMIHPNPGFVQQLGKLEMRLHHCAQPSYPPRYGHLYRVQSVPIHDTPEQTNGGLDVLHTLQLKGIGRTKSDMAPDRLSRERCESTELPTRCLDTTECTHPDTPASQPPHAHTHSSPSATSGDDSPDKHRPATDRYTHTRTQSHKSGLTYTVASRSATHLSAVPGEGSARDRPRSQPPRRICALPPKLVFKRTSTQPNLNRTSDFGTGPG